MLACLNGFHQGVVAMDNYSFFLHGHLICPHQSNGETSILWLRVENALLEWFFNDLKTLLCEVCDNHTTMLIFQSSQLVVHVIRNNVTLLLAISHIHNRVGFIVEFTFYLVFLYKEGYATKHVLKLIMTSFL